MHKRKHFHRVTWSFVRVELIRSLNIPHDDLVTKYSWPYLFLQNITQENIEWHVNNNQGNTTPVRSSVISKSSNDNW